MQVRTLLRRSTKKKNAPARSRKGRKAAAIGAAIASLAGGMLIAGAPTASASGYCGSGYNMIDSYPMTHNGHVGGHIYLYYSGSSGYNCAVAVGSVSGANHIGVGLSSDSATRNDPRMGSGHNYHYYAGPIYVYARHSCVTVWGGLYDGDFDKYLSGTIGPTHCG
jgi:hypothetical protein